MLSQSVKHCVHEGNAHLAWVLALKRSGPHFAAVKIESLPPGGVPMFAVAADTHLRDVRIVGKDGGPPVPGPAVHAQLKVCSGRADVLLHAEEVRRLPKI